LSPVEYPIRRATAGSWSRRAAEAVRHALEPGHRGPPIAFTLAVVADFVARARGEPPVWLTHSPLPPLLLPLSCSRCRMAPGGAPGRIARTVTRPYRP
jgi:hypothetical protein